MIPPLAAPAFAGANASTLEAEIFLINHLYQ